VTAGENGHSGASHPELVYVQTQSELVDAVARFEDGGTVVVREGQGNFDVDLSQMPNAAQQGVVRTQASDASGAPDLTIVMPGSDGHDRVYGANNKDILKGGGGLDRLMGGGDRDIFVFSAGTGTDIVYDFTDGEDRIYLDRIAFEDITVSAYRGDDTLLQVGTDRMILRDFDHAKFSENDTATTEDWFLT